MTDPIQNVDETQNDATADALKRRRQRFGDGLIILDFVVGVAGIIIGFSSNSSMYILAGVVLTALGVLSLISPRFTQENNAPVWQCNQCGWVFEKQVQHRRSSIECECPHCHLQTVCNRIERK